MMSLEGVKNFLKIFDINLLKSPTVWIFRQQGQRFFFSLFCFSISIHGSFFIKNIVDR